MIKKIKMNIYRGKCSPKGWREKKMGSWKNINKN